ncbi:MAG: GlxA family transcriptional regulator [Pontibacterium sp.]
MNKVLGLVFDDYQASGIATTFDVFNVVNTIWKQRGGEEPLYECYLVSAGQDEVRASNGCRLRVDYTLDNAPDADLIFVPGIHHEDGNDLINHLGRLKRETEWLRKQYKKGQQIVANCSGVFLLAETGQLKAQSAATAWWLGGLFQKRYPDIRLRTDTLLVENKQGYCTGAMTANLGVMLQVVEQQVGRQLAQTCAKTMLIDVSQGYASPYVFLQAQTEHQDALVLAVESWMQRHINQPLDLVSLAQLHCVSGRTLSRRFKKALGLSPSEYLQKLRIEHTKLLLETTSLTIEQIVEKVGYSNASSLRRLFRTALGLSPREYRLSFS